MTVMKAIAAALLLAAGVASVAAAQSAADFPSRPVRLLVPFAAGGPTDVVARILADLLSVRWGGPSVVIANRPGARTLLATAAPARAPPPPAAHCSPHPFPRVSTRHADKSCLTPRTRFSRRSAWSRPSRSRSSPTNRFPPTPFRNWWLLRERARRRSTSPRRGRAA